MEKTLECLIKAKDDINFLDSDILEAHSSTKNRLLEILLRSLLEDIRPIKVTLEEIIRSMEE